MKKTLITIAGLLAAFQLAAANKTPREVVFKNDLKTGASAHISFGPGMCKNYTLFAAPNSTVSRKFAPPCCPKKVEITDATKKKLFVSKTKIRKEKGCDKPTFLHLFRNKGDRKAQLKISERVLVEPNKARKSHKSQLRGARGRRPSPSK